MPALRQHRATNRRALAKGPPPNPASLRVNEQRESGTSAIAQALQNARAIEVLSEPIFTAGSGRSQPPVDSVVLSPPFWLGTCPCSLLRGTDGPLV